MPKKNALSQLVQTIKEEKKAERSISTTLRKIIDDYCVSGEFDGYLQTQGHIDVPKNQGVRLGRWRASAAGKCVQWQAFDAAAREKPGKIAAAVQRRTAKNQRALQNGTFGHLRWATLFDALHHKGVVRTICAEQTQYDKEWQLTGTADRVVDLFYLGDLCRVVIDFKTMNSRRFQHLAAPEVSDMLQQHAYHKFPEFKADFWVMMYENKDTHELKLFDAPYSDVAMARLRNNYRIADVWVNAFLAEKKRERLPLIVDHCNYCPYEEACLVENPDLREQQKRIGDDDHRD